jgi:hypothetical protein
MKRSIQVADPTLLLICLTPLAFTVGCAIKPTASPPSPAAITLTGRVHGGQQPVSGANIQLYGDGLGFRPSSIAFGSPARTDSQGNFSLTGTYTCPSPAIEVYLVAMGGDPGLGKNNPNIGMMAALGPCGNLTTSEFIWVNEATTVASVEALSTYMYAYNSMGPDVGDPTQFTTQFALVNQYVNIATGSAPGPALPAGYDASTGMLYTLSNVLASCINSPGGVAGDGSTCGQLFALTTQSTVNGGTSPTDTLSAMIQIAHYPTNNVSAIFGLATADPPFQPALATPPAAFTLTIQPLP